MADNMFKLKIDHLIFNERAMVAIFVISGEGCHPR